MFPIPRLDKADPGHIPLIPHPIPKIIAPMTVFLLSVRCLGLKFPLNNGLGVIFGIMFIAIKSILNIIHFFGFKKF